MTPLERKVYRKKRRIAASLNAAGIVVCDQPRRTLLVGNYGLLTGGSVETLLTRFPHSCAPYDVLMVAGRQFCWLLFESVELARRAVSLVDGVADSPVLYLFYVDDEQFERSAVDSASSIRFGCPPGADIIEEFISAEQETRILDELDWDGCNGSCLKQRQVVHFGHAFDYGTNGVDRRCCGAVPALPDWSQPIIDRLLKTGAVQHPPDQLTVNKYRPGDGIPAHCDTHSVFDEHLVCVSLLSPCVMQLSRDTPQQHNRLSVLLPRRSALVLSGEARYGWKHAIIGRQTDVVRDEAGKLKLIRRSTRVSLTFRRVMPANHECRCAYPALCDSRRLSESEPHNQLASYDLAELERRFVVDVYDQIAEHFSSTRHTAWPRVAQFVRDRAAHVGTSFLLDIGCGNGKYLNVLSAAECGRVFSVGVDRSESLCAVTANRQHQTLLADCVGLPVRDACVDCVLCIAVLHHLASRQRRRRALAEIARVMRPGARALVYVWAREQRRAGVCSRYVSAQRTADCEQRQCPVAVDGAVLPVHASRTDFQQQDVLVPWKSQRVDADGDVRLRFYHVYEEGELEQDALSVSTLSVINSYYDQGNWCVELTRTSA